MTDAELTILSLVSEGARYGYEIQQLIDERGLREWLSVGFASIYYILNRLERQKLIISEMRTGGAIPAQRVYQITDAGRGVLQTAIVDLLRQPRSLGTGFELGLANLQVLKSHQVYKVMSHHRNDLKQRLALIEKAWERHNDEDNDQPHIQALYTHSIALMRAELVWMNDFITDWLARHPSLEDHRETQETDQVDEAHSAKTRLNRRVTPDPAKMIQRLKRPKAEE